MEVIIEDKKHIIIYVEYQNGIPHSVVTKFYVPKAVNGAYWRPVYWDFFAENGDLTDVRYSESGSGGNAAKIYAPQWVDGYIGRYWISEEASFEGEVKNGKKLKNLRIINTYWGRSQNPFKHSEQVSSYEYCDRCKNYVTQCDEHIYVDDAGNKRYFDDDSYC